VEKNVDKILVSPGDLVAVLFKVWYHLLSPSTWPHSGEVH